MATKVTAAFKKTVVKGLRAELVTCLVDHKKTFTKGTPSPTQQAFHDRLMAAVWDMDSLSKAKRMPRNAEARVWVTGNLIKESRIRVTLPAALARKPLPRYCSVKSSTRCKCGSSAKTAKSVTPKLCAAYQARLAWSNK